MKNKLFQLFQITKEFREFNFEQNLRIEFTKNDKVFENKIFAGPCQRNQLSSSVERWTYEGSH